MWQTTCPVLGSSLHTPLFSLPTIHTYLSIQFTNGEDVYRCQMRVCGDCLSYPFWFKAVKDSFLVLANTHLASKCISNCWSEWKDVITDESSDWVEGCCQLMCRVSLVRNWNSTTVTWNIWGQQKLTVWTRVSYASFSLWTAWVWD